MSCWRGWKVLGWGLWVLPMIGAHAVGPMRGFWLRWRLGSALAIVHSALPHYVAAFLVSAPFTPSTKGRALARRRGRESLSPLPFTLRYLTRRRRSVRLSPCTALISASDARTGGRVVAVEPVRARWDKGTPLLARDRASPCKRKSLILVREPQGGMMPRYLSKLTPWAKHAGLLLHELIATLTKRPQGIKRDIRRCFGQNTA